jgi:hypothetical protein
MTTLPEPADSLDERSEQVFRQFGSELEAAHREAGVPLPDGMSGYDFVRAMMEESRRLAERPAIRARMAAMRAAMEGFVAEVAAELPGGSQHPDFHDRLIARMRPWMESQSPFDEEASA